MKNPFAVNVATILGKSGRRVDVDETGSLEGLETSGSHATDAPVKLTGHIDTIEGGLVFEGEVDAAWQGECRRCLGDAEGQIAVKVREVFEKNPTEGETYAITGDFLDLEPLVRETVMLEMPIAPSCKEDCAGLCPECGANKNEVDCGHASEPTDNRWAALDQLKGL